MNTFSAVSLAEEFAVYPADQQDKILDFIRIFESVGLADFSLYPGKFHIAGLD